MWESEIAEVYDATSARMFEPAVLDPTVEFLAAAADDQPALEFAIGTGRVALPLAERGVTVAGIELSPHMIEKLHEKSGANLLQVHCGDMKETRVKGTFGLVYLVYNTIMNVTSQDEQVAVFENAAAHLAPGGSFVVEVSVPRYRDTTARELGSVFLLESDHIGLETWEPDSDQLTWSHHWMTVDDRLVRLSAPFRYVWPSELVLMGRLAGFRLRERWATWTREEFNLNSLSQIAVFEKVPPKDPG